MSKHQLMASHLQILLTTLSSYAKKIDSVGLFGSRATGMARKNSDIDIVLYGNISDDIIDRLWTLLNENPLLSLKVDIIAYNSKMSPLLKQHIDTVNQTLFTNDNLLNYAKIEVIKV